MTKLQQTAYIKPKTTQKLLPCRGQISKTELEHSGSEKRYKSRRLIA